MAYNNNNTLYEILSWMPPKAIIKFSSSLCKELCNIQSEYDFIKKQCIHSLGQDNGFFLQPKRHGWVPKLIEFHILPWLQHSSSSLSISRKLVGFLHRWRILTSSNGLVLLGLENRCFCPPISYVKFGLCNPATMIWAPLSPPSDYNLLFGDDFCPLFECYPQQHGFPHSFKTDYTIALLVTDKAVVGETDTNKKQLLIYSDGKWEDELCNVSIQGRVMRYDSPVAIFSDGGALVVHYLCDSLAQDEDPPYIAAFDIRKKKHLRSIRLPKGAWHMGRDQGCKSGDRLWIFKSNNDTSICLVRWFQAKFTVWVVEKTGGNVESWRRVMNKTQVEIFGCEEEQDNDVKSFSIVGGRNLLLATSKRVFVFGMVAENKGKLEVVGKHDFGQWDGVTFVPYANTLRPVPMKE